MFHGKHPVEAIDRTAAWVGLKLEPAQRGRLERYAAWLGEEAIPAGGIGPQEADRLVERHVADALSFAVGWKRPPRTLLDVGSGVGLPGIPLAIVLPGTRVTLVDRAERRCRLARRAVRVLQLGNVEVVQRDVRHLHGRWEAVVARAVFDPAGTLDVVAPVLSDEGVAIIGLSRASHPQDLPPAPVGTVVDLLAVPAGVLDTPAWLLRMTATRHDRPGSALN